MGFKVVVTSVSRNRVASSKNSVQVSQNDSTSTTLIGINSQTTKLTSLVQSEAKNRISVNSQKNETVRFIRSSATSRLDSLLDVDASDADNNETLVYDATTGKYVVRTIPNLDGGNF
jgi:hypothetical protein